MAEEQTQLLCGRTVGDGCWIKLGRHDGGMACVRATPTTRKRTPRKRLSSQCTQSQKWGAVICVHEPALLSPLTLRTWVSLSAGRSSREKEDGTRDSAMRAHGKKRAQRESDLFPSFVLQPSEGLDLRPPFCLLAKVFDSFEQTQEEAWRTAWHDIVLGVRRS